MYYNMKYTFQVTVVLKKQTWRSKKYEVIWSAMHIGKVDDNDDGDEMDKRVRRTLNTQPNNVIIYVSIDLDLV